MDSVQQLKTNLAQFAEQKKQLSKEIRDLANSNSVLRSQLTEEKNNNRELRQELDFMNTELQSQKVDLQIQSLVSSCKNQNRDILEQTITNNEACLAKMQQLENHLISSSNKNKQLMNTNQQEIANLQKQLQEKDIEMSTLRTANSTLKNQTVQLKEHIVSLENLISIKDDVFGQLTSAHNTISALEQTAKSKDHKISELQLLIETDAKKQLKLTQTVDSLTKLVNDKQNVSLLA